MDFSTVWLTAIANGIMMGAIYGIVSLGLGLIYGVIDIVNFAHGTFLTLALFLVYFFYKFLGIDPYVAIIPVALIVYLLGDAVQRWLIMPLVNREKGTNFHLSTILMTAGLSWAMMNSLLFFFSANYRIMDTVVTGKVITVAGIAIPVARLIGLIVSVAVLIGLQLFLAKTDLGRAVRAISQDRQAAQLMGINSVKIYRFSFGLGIGLVGIAACLLAPFYFVHPQAGETFSIMAFIIVVLGGMGSVLGTFVAGLIVGMIEMLGTQMFSLQIARIFVFGIFIAVLIFRPCGLFGRRL